tara:strand:- start:689 stop:1180 length:492 start_codon:yes stop_codon:yes gene_type:complete
MHILIKNKFLNYGDYKVKCSIGKRGINSFKREGDLTTPRGNFKIKGLFYRKDRIKKLKTKLKKTVIKKNMGWCDEPISNKYNKMVHLPFSRSYEKLYRKDNMYDLILPLDYNMKPVRRYKGSAIFIHVAKKKFSPTKGCIALRKNDLIKLLKLIKKTSIVKII